jgi:murein DD-endopeptidase MepM/ murein hydrolase activator NlpD
MLFDSNGILGINLTTADQLNCSSTHGNTRKYQLTAVSVVFETGRTVYGRIITLIFDGEIISHGNGVVSLYSNLSAENIAVSEGQKVASGDKIGVVGDTSLSELADEPHLHFGVKLNDVSVNPLDYISESSKEASLGITE